MSAGTGTIESATDGDRARVRLGGRWDIRGAGGLDRALAAVAPPSNASVVLDLAALETLDTAVAWVLHRHLKRLRRAGHAAEIADARPGPARLLDLVAANDRPIDCHSPRQSSLIAVVAHVGRASLETCGAARRLLGFLGLTTLTMAGTLIRPWRIRWTATISHMERAGLDALPIVGLMSFLIGVVLAYQGADQLRRFGAEIFVVNLIGISILREIGILITAIIIAGRSGSAFTAAIGSMVVREEVDAMRTLALDPMEVLVLPRVVALVLTLPLLAFVSDVMGLLGGGLLAWIALDIAPDQFIQRLGDAVSMWSFWIGIIKAPVFAFLIAMIGCYEGFEVRGSAESVGRHTTKAVVEAIFLVIVVDAAFSILFARLHI